MQSVSSHIAQVFVEDTRITKTDYSETDTSCSGTIGQCGFVEQNLIFFCDTGDCLGVGYATWNGI